MLALNDDAWSGLSHAQGMACDIPARLRELAAFPTGDMDSTEPYLSLRRALLHQNCVFTASYAALPHLIEIMADSPERAHPGVLELVTRIEIARAKGNGPLLQDALAAMYQAALERLPQLISALSRQSWDEPFTRIAAAALAASRNQARLAEAILELKPGKLAHFMDTVADDE